MVTSGLDYTSSTASRSQSYWGVLILVHGDHYFRSVCLFVCLFVYSFSQPSLIRFRSNLDICYVSGSSCVPWNIGAVRPLGAGWPLKTCIFRDLGSQKLSRPTVLIGLSWFGYIVERTNTKILSSHFFAIFILNPNYDVMNDVISGFAKVVVERCGLHPRPWTT